jgi:hypothetical protein
MTLCEQEEYRALRATIRERGTARIWVFTAGFAVWAALTFATAVVAATPLAVLLPLLVLAATFEAVFALHVGVERVGRYLQVFYEDQWERVAMQFGRPSRAVHIDALFLVPFLVAVVVNLAPLLVARPVPVEWIFVAGPHALLVLRLATARAGAGRQRAIDLERFRQLKAAGISRTHHGPTTEDAEDAEVKS